MIYPQDNEGVDKGWKQREIGSRFGYSWMHVCKLLSLLNLTPEQQVEVSRGNISINQGYAISRNLLYKPLDYERDHPTQKCGACGSECPSYEVQSVKLCANCRVRLAREISMRRRALIEKAQACARSRGFIQKSLTDEVS